MDIPLILSGNFGELRSNHFHSGIDIKTNGITGQKIHSIESGHVSRIKVQPGGYGKALYIDHENGYTSVYGHLDRYSEKIDTYVKKIQYAAKRHGIDTYLSADELKIEKGELIAFSGNTGSSSGPHLHFEIRKTRNQIPTNCLAYGFPVADQIAPVFKTVNIYQKQLQSNASNYFNLRKEFTPRLKNDQYVIDHAEIPIFSGQIAFGIEIYDYLDGARNRCGVLSLELFIDDKLYFHSVMDEFSFGESRFINAHIDYPFKQQSGKSVQIMFKQPYNDLSIYRHLKNNGWFNITDTASHHILIRAKDTYGNSSELTFHIIGTGHAGLLDSIAQKEMNTLPFNSASALTDQQVHVSFPSYSFYDNVPFSFSSSEGCSSVLSRIYHIGNPDYPVHRAFSIALIDTSLNNKNIKYACIVNIDRDDELNYAGGAYLNGALKTEVREFGKYAIALDSIAPTIAPLDFYKGKKIGRQPGIRFRIEDNLSGIRNYSGYIDGKWVLFEYDPKNSLLFYEFDDRFSKTEKKHDLEIHLDDNLGNKTIYQTYFYL